jgi:hypothetical protein
MAKKKRAQWKQRPEDDDYEAALDYLSLQFTRSTARRLVAKARSGPCTERIVKDLLRASDLPLLSADEKHVAADLKRIHKGRPMSPIIVIQGDLAKNRPCVIADGYHRVCAACHADEDAPVAAVLVGF